MESGKRGKGFGTVLLIISLLANILLLVKYAETARLQNTAWSNISAQFAKVAHWAAIDAERLSMYPVTEETFGLMYTNPNVISSYLESISFLPYADKIVPFKFAEKIRILANYQYRVMSLMEDEIKQKGKVSPENAARAKALMEAWRALSGNISEEENKIYPFSAIFQERSWQKVWARGIEALDKVELLPLPEEEKR
ncbi:MAG: hypothetical protein ACOY4Q_07675 [Bacillota bacterium]